MSTARKRISIYDYPEHLNPFSEYGYPNVPDTRTIIVDKFRKNSTWSSKISKKLNRSVSWIEKSWLAVDESPRRTYENRICNDLRNSTLFTKQSQTHNETRTESCSDIRHDVETSHHMQISNDNSLEKSKSVENINKCDTRKRKKRPAPLPPSPTSIPETVKEKSPEVDTKLSETTCEIAVKSRDDVSASENDISSTEITEHEDRLVDEMSNVEDNLTQIASCEQTLTLTPVSEVQLSEEMQNLQIESDKEERSKSPECSEHEINQVEDDNKCENIPEDVQPDENANIPSIKNENDSKVHCNGNAVSVVND